MGTYGDFKFLLPEKPPKSEVDRVLARRTPSSSSVTRPSACTSEGNGGCVAVAARGSITLPWWPRSPTTTALVVTMIVAAWEAPAVALSPTARVAESRRPTAMAHGARCSGFDSNFEWGLS